MTRLTRIAALAVLVLAGLWVGEAQAQKTAAQLATEISTNLPSGSPSTLTAAALRATLNDMVLSFGVTAGTVPNLWTPDAYFASGRPWCDVKAKGAKGDAATDDTAAFLACQTTLAALGSGMIYVPPGNYCIKTAGGVTLTTNRIMLVGSGTGTVLQTCGADVTPLTLNGFGEVVQNLSLEGPDILATTHDAFDVGTGCVECVIFNVHAQYGKYAIFAQGVDATFLDSRTDVAYGTAQILIRAGSHWKWMKTDQNFVGASPAAGSLSVSGWTNAHVYSANAIVTVVQGGVTYKLQTVAGGTSSAVQPVIPGTGSYSASIVDNTVTWKLLAPDTYCATQVDSGNFSLHLEHGDYTGPFSSGICLTNSLATTAPQSVYISMATTGQSFVAGIDAAAGNDLHVTDSQIANCLNVGCIGILFESSWVGDATLTGNTFFANSSHILVNAGKNVAVTGNLLYGGVAGSAGVNVGANINTFSAIGNICGTSAAWGAVANCALVNAGTSDHYVINNICDGVTSNCVSDAGTGTHKVITNEGKVAALTTIAGTAGLGTETNPQQSLVWSANATTGFNIAGHSGPLFIGADGNNPVMGLVSFANGGTVFPAWRLYAARGPASAPTALQSGDVMGVFSWSPAIGANTFPSGTTARLSATVTENQSNTNQGNKISLETTKNGTATRHVVATIDGNEHLQVGLTVPTINSCSTGTVTAGSTDQAGGATATGATTCAINFATAFASAPFCVASDATGAHALQVSTTTAILTVAGLTSNDVFSWICFPKLGG